MLRSLIVAMTCTLAVGACTRSPSTAPASATTSTAGSGRIEFITHHQLTLNGTLISFTARAGETILYTDAGEPSASIFSYAYIKDPSPGTTRPVMFLTGGGPGGASYSLNVGFAGPWVIPPGRLALGGKQPPAVTPPYDLIDNPNTLLDVADLVFIDPVGTGYSRAIGSSKGEDFWGLDEDLESYAQFIQLWLTQNGRWNSPKFFLGESYGGTRAALIPNILMGGPSYPAYLRAIALNGTISLVNGFGLALGATGLDPVWTAATNLPNQAATAWYHNAIDRRGRSLEQFYDEAVKFASTAYVDAVKKEIDKKLAPAERETVVHHLVELTGLPASAYAKSLIVSPQDFAVSLLAARGVSVGVYDSRFTFALAGGGGDPVADDPALGRTFPVFSGAFMVMEHDKLNVRMSRPFVAIHWRDLLPHWTYAHKKGWYGELGPLAGLRPRIFATNADELAVAMHRNDHLHVMVATGYYDLNTSPAAARYTMEQAGIPKDRLVLEALEAGHEPYVEPAVAARLAQDIRTFIKTSADAL